MFVESTNDGTGCLRGRKLEVSKLKIYIMVLILPSNIKIEMEVSSSALDLSPISPVDVLQDKVALTGQTTAG